MNPTKGGRYATLCLSLLLTTASAQAASVFFDFGPSTGLATSGASTNTAGVALVYPFNLAPALVITTSSGNLYCVNGAAAGADCASSTGLTTGNAYGLGVGGLSNARIDPGETLTFTVQPGYVVTLTSFAVSAFSGAEQILYNFNGGANTVLNAPGVNVALDSFAVGSGPFSTLNFGAGNGGNYSLAQITFDITAVPEPGTVGVVLTALAALGVARRRLRA